MRLSIPPLLLLCACTDLPEGWEDARRVSDFTQSDCDGSPYDTATPDPTVTAQSLEDDVVALSAEPLTFRCAQEVEGLWRSDGATVDLLVQPVNMHPKVVAGCDCLYRIDATVIVPGAEVVTVWRRWDALNEPNDPVLVGEATVTP